MLHGLSLIHICVKDYREREIIEGGKLRRIQVIPMKDRIAVQDVYKRQVRKPSSATGPLPPM